MKTKLKLFLLGAVVGLVVGFPLGINFGRDEPLLSNPFAKRDIQQRVKESVGEKTETLVEGAKEKIHEATKPVRKEMEKRRD